MLNMWKVTIVLEQFMGPEIVYCFIALADSKEGAIEMAFDQFEYMPDYKTRRVIAGEIKEGILQIQAQ